MTRLYLTAAPFVLIAGAAQAGETVVYAQIPDWVEQSDVAALASADGPAELLYDWQYRINSGVVHAYTDRAVRIDNPESLMAENTLSLTWLPDKGDLTIHRLEIHRAGSVIDLSAQGAQFEVIRREQGLEQRLLDGQLTATLSVPGLREGDVLRTAFTISTDDQALGDDVQVVQFLPSEPWQVVQARTIVSWPADEEMFWGAESRVPLGEPELRGDYMRLAVELPLAEPDPVPNDAPWRFRRPSVLRVGSFSSWSDLSRVMFPHFDRAAQTSGNSPVAQAAQRIMAQSSDPLERAAIATRLVQDEVSYLLNGLEGGNYLPQSADETWAARYGDCKAKSVLLHTLLSEMGITSETVLVNSRGGDAVPELLPLPAAFDHMIVHAVIDGTDYWLDGTSAATRLANIGDVPPFHYALPLREGGAELVPMVPRKLGQPQMAMSASIDHTAGIDLPQLVKFELRLSGSAGAPMRAIADAADPEVLRQMANRFTGGNMEAMQVGSLTIDYDDDVAIATIVIEGVSSSSFDWTDGRFRMDLSEAPDPEQFNPDRARSIWREIPVAIGGNGFLSSELNIALPENGKRFMLNGKPATRASFATTTVVNEVELVGEQLRAMSQTISLLGEIPAADLPDVKRAVRRAASERIEVIAPEDVTWRWERSEAERKRLAAPIIEAYDAAIAFADKDNQTPLLWRAFFKSDIYDYPAALADLDLLAKRDPSVWVYQTRSDVKQSLGDYAGAIADQRAAYDLDPGNGIALQLAGLLARNDEFAAADELVSSLSVSEDERTGYVDTLAHIAALGGDPEAGLALIAELVAAKPNNADALNSDCWFRGLYDIAIDDAIARCTQAVERAASQAAAIDSRALVWFRQGNLEKAIEDLDAVLDLAPGQSASLYLRGVVRLHAGDKGGETDIAQALTISPELPRFYDRHSIKPPV